MNEWIGVEMLSKCYQLQRLPEHFRMISLSQRCFPDLKTRDWSRAITREATRFSVATRSRAIQFSAKSRSRSRSRFSSEKTATRLTNIKQLTNSFVINFVTVAAHLIWWNNDVDLKKSFIFGFSFGFSDFPGFGFGRNSKSWVRSCTKFAMSLAIAAQLTSKERERVAAATRLKIFESRSRNR